MVATARDTSSSAAKALYSVPKAPGSKIIVVKVESTSDTDAIEAAKYLSFQGVKKLDVVIANAGIFKSEAFQKVAEMKTADLIEHTQVNAAGVVRLFQATLPLLQKSEKPRFCVISSGVATITGMEHIPFTVSSYGASKAMINYLTRRIHFENEELIAFCVHPGYVTRDHCWRYC